MAYSIFDIIGPVMVGPSSSHTAGAVRIGKMAFTIFEKKPVKVIIQLHGSFAATYKGHGTDRALVGGILGMDPDDYCIRDSLNLARHRGVQVVLESADLGDTHPNTARIILEAEDRERIELVGASIGGGKILILELDGFPLRLTGEYPSLVCVYADKPGMVAKVSEILAEYKVNIAFMRVSRRSEDLTAMMVVEMDQPIPSKVVNKISASEEFYKVKIIQRIT